jgi:hypothetical protein
MQRDGQEEARGWRPSGHRRSLWLAQWWGSAACLTGVALVAGVQAVLPCMARLRRLRRSVVASTR